MGILSFVAASGLRLWRFCGCLLSCQICGRLELDHPEGFACHLEDLALEVKNRRRQKHTNTVRQLEH